MNPKSPSQDLKFTRRIVDQIEIERVTTIYRLAPLPQAGAVVFVLLIGYALWGLVASAWVIGWVVARLSISALRTWESHRFERDEHRDERIDHWRIRFEILIVVDNLCWGVISVVFVPATMSTMLGTLLFSSVLCLMAIGVFVLLSSFRTAVINFLSMLLPVIGVALWVDYESATITLISVIIYGIVLTQESWRANQGWEEMTRLRLQSDAVAVDREKARDEAVKASTAKSHFLANMSHEIRTPMNGILGMTELLQTTQLNADQTRFAEGISKAGNALHELIGDILDLSKIEEGALSIERANFSLGELLADTAEAYSELGSKNGTSLVTNIELADLPTVSGDSIRIRQVVTNLLGNALKFTKGGTVTLKSSCIDSPSGDSRQWIRVAVHDTGIGISPEQLELLFKRFSQADSSTTRQYGGSGLGLVICMRLVELMEGEIHVESELGIGSKFWFDLPLFPKLEQSAGSNNLEKHREAQADKWPELRGARILVVEDNKINQEVVRSMLERLECEVSISDDGAQAVQTLKSQSYDLVLMDCQMPVMDGFEATKQIRASGTAQSRIPIIALTANVLLEDQHKCISAGMDDFLGKPVQISTLATMLSKHLKTS